MEAMPTTFKEAAEALIESTKKFARGEIKSVPHSDERQKFMALALEFLARDLGCELRTPLYLTSRAEFNVIAVDKNAPFDDLRPACRYGAAFAAVLNAHNPRCGISPGAHLLPESSWCMLNHFDAERLILAQFKLRHPDQEQ